MNECKHEDFNARVEVNRIEDKGMFTADVTIECAQCRKPFRFLGLPGGVSLTVPTVSIACTEARLPIAPGSLFEGLPGADA